MSETNGWFHWMAEPMELEEHQTTSHGIVWPSMLSNLRAHTTPRACLQNRNAPPQKSDFSSDETNLFLNNSALSEATTADDDSDDGAKMYKLTVYVPYEMYEQVKQLKKKRKIPCYSQFVQWLIHQFIQQRG